MVYTDVTQCTTDDRHWTKPRVRHKLPTGEIKIPPFFFKVASVGANKKPVFNILTWLLIYLKYYIHTKVSTYVQGSPHLGHHHWPPFLPPSLSPPLDFRLSASIELEVQMPRPKVYRPCVDVRKAAVQLWCFLFDCTLTQYTVAETFEW